MRLAAVVAVALTFVVGPADLGAQISYTEPAEVDIGWWAGRAKVEGDTRAEIAQRIADVRKDLPPAQQRLLDAAVRSLRADAVAAASAAMRDLAMARGQGLDHGFSTTYDGLRLREILTLGRRHIFCERADTLWLRIRAASGNRAEELQEEYDAIHSEWDC